MFGRVSGLLQARDDGPGVIGVAGLSAEIAGEVLALGEGIHDGLGDALCVRVKTHVLQHHHGGEEEGGGVGKILAGNVGGGT